MKADDIPLRFSKVKKGRTSFGRPYNYRDLYLPWEGDCTNVMSSFKKDGIIIGTEQGNLIGVDLTLNKAIAILKADEQLSGVALDSRFLWSVGRQRRLTCQHVCSRRVFFSISECADQQMYSDQGIYISKSFNKAFLVYNCGGLRFKVVNCKTKKIIQVFDIAEYLLKSHPNFKSFRPEERKAWRFVIGTETPKIFIAINRYFPHFIIFDYLTKKVEFFNNVFKRIDWKTGSIVPAIGMHVMASDHDDFIFFVNQVRDPQSLEIHSFYRFFQRDLATGTYKAYGTREFPSSLG